MIMTFYLFFITYFFEYCIRMIKTKWTVVQAWAIMDNWIWMSYKRMLLTEWQENEELYSCTNWRFKSDQPIGKWWITRRNRNVSNQPWPAYSRSSTWQHCCLVTSLHTILDYRKNPQITRAEMQKFSTSKWGKCVIRVIRSLVAHFLGLKVHPHVLRGIVLTVGLYGNII